MDHETLKEFRILEYQLRILADSIANLQKLTKQHHETLRQLLDREK